jgi:hypothetical protein
MTRSASLAVTAGLVLVACTIKPTTAFAGEIRYGGNRAELSISAVSDRTVQVLAACGLARPVGAKLQAAEPDARGEHTDGA